MHYNYRYSGQQNVSVLVTAGRFVGGNPTRVALCVSSPLTAAVTISNRPDVVSGSGIVLQAGIQPLVMRYDDWGEWLRGPLFAITSVGTEIIGVVETLEG